jgi:hypothetical protein
LQGFNSVAKFGVVGVDVTTILETVALLALVMAMLHLMSQAMHTFDGKGT